VFSEEPTPSTFQVEGCDKENHNLYSQQAHTALLEIIEINNTNYNTGHVEEKEPKINK